MRLEGRVNQTGNIVGRMLTVLFTPWRAMTLTPSSGRPVTGDYPRQARTARIWLLGMLAALALARVGANSDNVALMSISCAGFVLSQVMAIRQVREFRRYRKGGQ
jgi:hypothetical protein